MARSKHTAWTPPSLPDSIVLLGGECGYDCFVSNYATKLNAEIVPGKKQTQASIYVSPGGKTFTLEHNGVEACGIPDEDSIVMTGGYPYHNYVTRC